MRTNASPTLRHIHDPMCGWCYEAAPLLRVARELLPMQAHGSGMMAGAVRRVVTPEMRQVVPPGVPMLPDVTQWQLRAHELGHSDDGFGAPK